MPPPTAPRQEPGDHDSNGKRDVDEAERVEDLGYRGQGGGSFGDHASQEGIVDPLDGGSRAVVGHQHEDRGGGQPDERCDDRVPPGHPEQRMLDGGPPFYPEHDAPAPHSARSSSRATKFTSAARGMELRALSAANTTVEAAPEEERSYVAHPPSNT